MFIIVAVKDRGVDAFMNPFVCQHRNQAVRSFHDEVNRVDSEMHKHPDDYDLYVLAAFNAQTGELTALERPELLVRAKDILEV